MVLFLLPDKIGNDEIGCVLAREGALIKPGRRWKHLHNPAMTIDRTVEGELPVSDIVEKATALVEELYAENPLPTIRIKPSEAAEPLPVTVSKFGGVPYLPGWGGSSYRLRWGAGWAWLRKSTVLNYLRIPFIRLPAWCSSG